MNERWLIQYPLLQFINHYYRNNHLRTPVHLISTTNSYKHEHLMLHPVVTHWCLNLTLQNLPQILLYIRIIEYINLFISDNLKGDQLVWIEAHSQVHLVFQKYVENLNHQSLLFFLNDMLDLGL